MTIGEGGIATSVSGEAVDDEAWSSGGGEEEDSRRR